MGTFQYLDEGNSEAQDRLATSFLLAQTSAGLARTGVLSGLTVTQTTTASGAVLVAAGAAPVQASVGTGVALLVNDTQATLDVFTANPVGGLPRNDVVAFDSITKAIIAITGTPNASPTDPTVPATACALARLRHAASATTIPTAKIDDLRVMTRLAGVRDPAVTATGGVSGPITGTWVTLATAPAVTGDGVKKFLITFIYTEAYSTVNGDSCQFAIRNGGTIVGPYQAVVLSGIWANGRTMSVFDTPAAGAVTYATAAWRNAGTGTVTVGASQIIVEQIA